jgi:hypothetical protein
MGGFAWLACSMSKMESLFVEFVRRLAPMLIMLDSFILATYRTKHREVNTARVVASFLSRIERIISVNISTVGIPIYLPLISNNWRK